MGRQYVTASGEILETKPKRKTYTTAGGQTLTPGASNVKTPTPLPKRVEQSQSNNTPSVSKQAGSGANAVGMASANLGAGVAKKQTIPVSQRQFGIGMRQTQAQPLPYAKKAEPQRIPYASRIQTMPAANRGTLERAQQIQKQAAGTQEQLRQQNLQNIRQTVTADAQKVQSMIPSGGQRQYGVSFQRPVTKTQEQITLENLAKPYVAKTGGNLPVNTGTYKPADGTSDAMFYLNAGKAGIANSAAGVQNALNIGTIADVQKSKSGEKTDFVNLFENMSAQKQIRDNIAILANNLVTNLTALDDRSIPTKIRRWLTDNFALNDQQAGELEQQLMEATKWNDAIQEEYIKLTEGKSDGQLYAAQMVQAIGQMAPSILANAVVPGSGMMLMTTSAGGNAAMDALKQGATVEQAKNRGILSGAMEYGTEKMFGGIPGLNKGIVKLGKAGDILGEGVEEGLSTFMSGAIDRATFNPDAKDPTWEEILYDTGVGIGTSGLMQLPGGIAKLAGKANGSFQKTDTHGIAKGTPYGYTDVGNGISDTYRSYMTPEAKQQYSNEERFSNWANKDLAYITAAAWDQQKIPFDVLINDPHIAQAQQKTKGRGNSLDINPPGTNAEADKKRTALMDWLLSDKNGSAQYGENGKLIKVNGKVAYNGVVDQGRHADIVIGRPAAGKSKVFADPLSADHHARIIDSDAVKPELDGYDKGYGAGYVQNESALIADTALALAVDRGDNIVIPRVGGKSIDGLVERLKDAGYTVSLYLNEVSQESSIMRAMSRFAEEGRYLDIEYLNSIGDKANKTFERLKGVVDYAEHRNNDVNIGEEPRLVYASIPSADLDAKFNKRHGSRDGLLLQDLGRNASESSEQITTANDGSFSMPETQRVPYAPGFNPDSQAAPQQLPIAEQSNPQPIPYNPAAQAAETPAQPILPMAEELNAERQKNAQEQNLPYANQNMGIVASPELAAAMQPIVDYTTAKPNPEGNRNIEGSVLDNLGQGQSAFDTLDNLLAQSKADAAKKPGAKEGIANVLTDRPKKFSKENFAEQKDKVMRKVVDSGYTIDTIAKDVDDKVLYPLYNNAKQSRQAAEYMIGEEQRDINGNRVGESLVSIFKPVTDNGTDYFRDFSTYLYHMHNADRMSLETNGAQIYQDAIMQLEMENPMLQNATREEVEALASGNSDYREAAIEWLQLDESLNNLQNKPVFGESITAEDSRKAAAELLRKNPEFAELADKVYAYNRNLMKYRVDSGLISQKQADIMNALYPHYVPTFRDTSSTTGMKISGNQAQVARTVRGATGSNLDLMRIDDSMAEQTMQTIRAAKQNLLGARLLEDALKHQDKVGRHVRSVIDRYNSYDMDDPPQLGNDITIFVGGKPVSMQADDGVMEAFQSIQPRKGERIAGLEAVVKANNTFKALVTGANPMFLAKNFARDLQDAGLYAGNLKDFAKNYPKAWTEMVNGGELWQLYKSQGGTGTSYFDYEKGIVTDPNGNIISKTFNKIEQLNMMVEQAPRFAEFMAVLEKEGRTYEGIQKAMLAAADVTVNFGRGGTATQFLNRTFVPFLNPAVQGADKLVRRFAETKGAKEWMGLIGRLVLLGIGPALLNELLYDDEEEYQMLNDRDKENNFVFPIGDGIWVKVPKGRALSVFGSAAQRGLRAIKGEKDAFNGFISQAYEQVGVPDPLTNNIFSQVRNADLLDPESPGKTWYGSDIEPQRLQGLPVAERYDEKTDELSKWLGKQLNVSPKKINYLLDNYSGVIGDFLLPYSTPQAERGGIFAPVVSAFSIDSVTNNKLSGEFYDKLDELEQAKNSSNPTAGAAAAYRYMNSVASEISGNNKEIREIQADTTINDKEKLEKVRKLRTTNNTLFKEALDSVPAYMEVAGKSGVVSDKELDKVYLDTNRKQFGAEYALEKYNKKVYEKAQKANKSLISYEAFYDAYFAQKDVTGDKDKNGKTIALSESGNKKLAIDKATPGLTQKQREVLYDMFDVSKSVWNGYIPNRK